MKLPHFVLSSGYKGYTIQCYVALRWTPLRCFVLFVFSPYLFKVKHWQKKKMDLCCSSFSTKVLGWWVESNCCLLLCVLHVLDCIISLKHGRKGLSPASSSAPWTAEVQRQSAELSSQLYRQLHTLAVKLCFLYSYLIDSLHSSHLM